MTKIKICGVQDQATAHAAVVAGADALGFVFYSKSVRFIDFEKAQIIIKALPPFISAVGLFVNAESTYVKQVLQQMPLTLLQFHGDESGAFCRQFCRPYMKAIRVKGEEDWPALLAEYSDACAFLLDSYHPKQYGGTGEIFNWDWIPKDLPKPIMLAGGLNAQNVTSAILKVRPYGVDVSGGVESEKGLKSSALIQAFCQAVRSVHV